MLVPARIIDRVVVRAGILIGFNHLFYTAISTSWTPERGPCRKPRRVQKYKRTLRPTRRAGAEVIYHYHGELNHQGLGNAFVFLDTTASKLLICGLFQKGRVLAQDGIAKLHCSTDSIGDTFMQGGNC